MSDYDLLPYDCHPIPWTAPEQLALVSLLHGGPCPPLHEVRLLEVGCGDGANLLSLAFHRPRGRFVGVDASPVQIGDARESARVLGLDNVQLHAADVTQMGDELGQFDFVVAHGVLSWVSDRVREGILALSREKLAPGGLLYASYNTHPGWLTRGTVREVMQAAAHPAKPPRERAEAARSRAATMRAPIEGSDHPYAALLSLELSRAEQADDSCVIHDYLSPDNRAFWFRDFASLTARFGLGYVAEAAFAYSGYRVPAEVSERARSLEIDPLEIETTIDLLWFRQHRASLFCRQEAIGSARPEALRERVRLACGLRAVSDAVTLDPGVEEVFGGYFEPDEEIVLADTLVKSAVVALSERWPHGIEWRSLEERSRALVEAAGLEPPLAPECWTALWDSLLDLHARGQVDLRLVDLPDANGDRVRSLEATALTRWEASRRGIVTTACHHRLHLGPMGARIVPHLDGRRSEAELIAILLDDLRADESRQVRSGAEPAGDDVSADALELLAKEGLEYSLALLGAWGLLEKP